MQDCAQLRVAQDCLFTILYTKTLMSAEKKKRCFSYTARQVWNNLPVNIRDSQSLMSFKRTLETHLYSHYFVIHISVHCFVVNIPFCNIFVCFSPQRCDLDCSSALRALCMYVCMFVYMYVWKNRGLSMELKVRLLRATVFSIASYGC